MAEQWVEEAARHVLDAIHFQCERPTHPENAKFLDRRSKEIAQIIADHAPKDETPQGTLLADDWHKVADSRSAEILRLNEKVAALQKRIMELENREASVCPEDVGCDEYIPLLEGRVAALVEVLKEAQKCIVFAGLPSDSHLMGKINAALEKAGKQ